MGSIFRNKEHTLIEKVLRYNMTTNTSNKYFKTLGVDTKFAVMYCPDISEIKYLAIIKTEFMKSNVNFQKFWTEKFIKDRILNIGMQWKEYSNCN